MKNLIVYNFLFWFLIGTELQAQKTMVHPVKRPNIIYFMADDLQSDALGFMSNPYVITPHLDSLASKGFVFKNTYSTSPICMPSRATVLLGQYLGTHGVGFDRPTNFTASKEEFKSSYPVMLRQSGYFTGFIGKFGLAVSNNEKLIRGSWGNGYEKKEEFMPKKDFDIWNGFTGQGNYLPLNEKFNGYDNKWNSDHLSEFIKEQIIAFLDTARKTNKPFCLSVSFKAPHAPWTPVKKYRELYNDKFIPRVKDDDTAYYKLLPDVVKLKSRGISEYFGRTKNYYGEEIVPDLTWHIEDDSTYQEFIKNYYALITGIDFTIGAIIRKLKEFHLDESTIIIFTSDNGFFTGSKQLIGKDLLYDKSARIPFLILDPRIKKLSKATEVTALISEIDFAPTILELGGVRIPKSYSGKSLIPILRGDVKRVHRSVYGENNFDNFYPIKSELRNNNYYQSVRSKYVRTDKYLYIRYQECTPVIEELFNIKDDPLETKNLIGDPKHYQTLNRMRKSLDNFEKKYVKYSNF